MLVLATKQLTSRRTAAILIEMHIFWHACLCCTAVDSLELRLRPALFLQEYIVNLWTQDREMSQPWSMHTFQSHINNETGSAAAFDRMWAQMQRIIGEHSPYMNCPLVCMHEDRHAMEGGNFMKLYYSN